MRKPDPIDLLRQFNYDLGIRIEQRYSYGDLMAFINRRLERLEKTIDQYCKYKGKDRTEVTGDDEDSETIDNYERIVDEEDSDSRYELPAFDGTSDDAEGRVDEGTVHEDVPEERGALERDETRCDTLEVLR